MMLMIGIGGSRNEIGGMEGRRVVMKWVVVLRMEVSWWCVGMVK